MKKKNRVRFFLILLLPAVLVAISVIVVDPFFHYHAPINGLPYVLSEERYQNDGIVKHFKYEAVITGSSTSQNFKTSDVNRLWGMDAVKVTFAGSTYKEQDRIVKVAASRNSDLKMVIRGLDISRINSDKDDMGYDEYPEYLYDDNPLNDYDYIFNKDVAVIIGKIAARILQHEGPESFDEYSNWSGIKTYGKQAVLSTFKRVKELKEKEAPLSEADYTRIYDNITQNIINTAKENPDTEFYIFFSPPSVYYWDAVIRTGSYDNVYDELKYTYSLLLEEDNIKLYSFFDKIDITGNIDNYMDTIHYSGDINTLILEWIKTGEGLMTRDNYIGHLDKVKEIYKSFDYESVF